ncbi:MAG: hypothetical protein IT182_05795 [Acidobacteria bacterium]|nr:hypothetical protein [Acidobacteriota bacterium]
MTGNSMKSGLVGVVCALVLGLVAAPAAAQSLGEVARKEAARREQLKAAGKSTEGKVYTNADLPKRAVVAGPGAPATVDVADGTADASSQTDDEASAPAEKTDASKPDTDAKKAPADDETGWRSRAERVNSAVSAAESDLRQLKALSDRLSLEAQASNPAIASAAQAERDQLRAQIQQAQDKAADARAEQQAFRQEAVVAGVPPGWVQ